MQSSFINFQEVLNKNQIFRLDAEYWHPFFIKNNEKIYNDKKIVDFIDKNIDNIKSSPISKDFEYLEISNIPLEGVEYRTIAIEQGREPDRAYHILKEKDVVVSTVRPNRNAVAFVQKDAIVGSSGLAVLRAKDIEAEYLFIFCKTNYFIKCLVRATKATMYPAVSISDIEGVPFLEVSDQYKTLIVQAVKKALVLSQKAKEIYNQAEDAILSELGLNKWQPKHQLSFVKNFLDIKQAGRIDSDYFQPKYDKIVNTIENYSGGWDILGNLVSVKKCTEVGKNKYMDEGIPFVRVSNLNPFEITKTKYISKEIYEEIQAHQPEKGEILLSKDATPGIAYYLNIEPEKMIPSSGIMRLKNKLNQVNNEYLTLVLNSIIVKEQINRDAGGTIILHWKPDQIKETKIPILPEKKQEQIQKQIIEFFDLREKSKHLLELAILSVEEAIDKGDKVAIKKLKMILEI